MNISDDSDEFYVVEMASEDEEEEEEKSEYDKDESWLIFPIVYFSKTWQKS